ncbi:MAG: GNAT family N-acetyltransferase [Elusimicrobiota bacterium]|nr:GNAT family N-acetyltransferase [Elusimicrobiota bacterium]
MNATIVKFYPLTATEELWDGFLRGTDEHNREADPEEPLLPREKRKALMVSAEANPDRRVYRFLIFPEGDIREAAGCATVSVETPHSPSYGTNKHVGTLLLLFISQKHRGKGLGALLLKRVIEELAAKEPAVSEFLSPVILEPGERFMNRRGGTVSLETAENRLYLSDLDWVTVEAWAAGSARRNPATTVMTVSSIPREDLEDYSAAYTETINQQPLGDVSIAIKYTPEQIRFDEQKNLEQGLAETTIYTRESDGKVSGLTETLYLKEAGHRITQMMTGVREAYRGCGLGKLVKARMLLHIRKEYPGVKYIVTSNAESNASMQAINRQLGFKKHLSVKLYKLKI